VLLPDAVELGTGVFPDLGLDILDVVLVERAWFSILEDHQVDVFLGGECEAGEDFERGGGNTTLIGARILEDDDFAFLKIETRLLSQEEVGALDDVFEMWLAITIDEPCHVGDVDSFGSVRSTKVNLEARIMMIRLTNRPPQGTNKSALNLKWAPFLKSVPSKTTSPAIQADNRCQ